MVKKKTQKKPVPQVRQEQAPPLPPPPLPEPPHVQEEPQLQDEPPMSEGIRFEQPPALGITGLDWGDPDAFGGAAFMDSDPDAFGNTAADSDPHLTFAEPSPPPLPPHFIPPGPQVQPPQIPPTPLAPPAPPVEEAPPPTKKAGGMLKGFFKKKEKPEEVGVNWTANELAGTNGGWATTDPQLPGGWGAVNGQAATARQQCQQARQEAGNKALRPIGAPRRSRTPRPRMACLMSAAGRPNLPNRQASGPGRLIRHGRWCRRQSQSRTSRRRRRKRRAVVSSNSGCPHVTKMKMMKTTCTGIHTTMTTPRQP
ncbi:hypothetical protein BKA62DRAFT_400351 [Auriculariales sp. MPI-PUGE-AT-0066]|nr:hypothetical protein BKA62DRAFT_400351 [Auriculariales sp. MPI-PUGE-AT-0066]